MDAPVPLPTQRQSISRNFSLKNPAKKSYMHCKDIANIKFWYVKLVPMCYNVFNQINLRLWMNSNKKFSVIIVLLHLNVNKTKTVYVWISDTSTVVWFGKFRTDIYTLYLFWIDCINYFVHREMNLKNRIAHFMKAEPNRTLYEGFHKVCEQVFLDCDVFTILHLNNWFYV